MTLQSEFVYLVIMTDQAKTVQPGDWESICKRCGRCCYEKVEFEGRVYYTDQPCEHLDLETRLCRIYERRSELRPGCARLDEEKLRAGILPADCPYVRDIEDYPAPQLDPKIILP